MRVNDNRQRSWSRKDVWTIAIGRNPPSNDRALSPPTTLPSHVHAVSRGVSPYRGCRV